MYLIPHLYRITSSTNHLSISRLCHAFQAVITRHKILRTALYLDTNGTIMQHCLDSNVTDDDDMKSVGFSVINLPHTNESDDHNIDETINDIINHPDFLYLSQGRVIHCHIIRHCSQNDASNQLTLFQLGLATFYAFLFKLTHGERDLCIASVNANRYRPELEEMIGLIVNGHLINLLKMSERNVCQFLNILIIHFNIFLLMFNLINQMFHFWRSCLIL
jgi:hypothetical protein